MKRIQLEDLALMLNKGEIVAAEYCFCCKKIRYPSRQEAAAAGAEIAKRGKGHSRPYQCKRRGGWHLTAKEARQPSSRYGKRRGA